jgi:uncharacterized sulfatase
MSPPPQPNILLISSDQQHANLLGCLNPELRTPHLDQLARDGTMFTRAYCPNPTCTPTRASIITGLYPSQHGAYTLGAKLPETVPTVGDALQQQGYATSLIGKAHFQPLTGNEKYPSLESSPAFLDWDRWRKFTGPFYGFQHIEISRMHGDEGHVGQHYGLWLEDKAGSSWRQYFRPPGGTSPAQRGHWNIPKELHPNAWIAERTEARLSHHAATGRPFFLWSSFFDPHPPYVVPAPYDSLYDPAKVTVPRMIPGEHDRNPPHFRKTQEESPDFSAWRDDPEGHPYIHGCHSHLEDPRQLARNIAVYYGMMTFLDAAVGRILARLDQLGLRENTLVVFTSDHGHYYGQHGLTAKGPFHYEDGVRVPFIARWPGRVPANHRSEALQSLVDLSPSFLSTAGAPVPLTMSGVDQTAVWRGEQLTARDHVIVENHHQPTTMHLRTYIDARYKLTVYRGETFGELFDLATDPAERHNLWDEPAAAPMKTEVMRRMLSAEMAREPRHMPRLDCA